MFTLCTDDEERRAFLAALAAAAADPGARTVVIVTLRADFYPHLADHPAIADLVAANQSLVTAMDEVGLAEAIEGPARSAGIALEPGLTETILRDTARRPGALPLLSHALLELWRNRSDGTLTLAGYAASGGVEGAVAQRAEATFLALDDVERAVARRVLLRLTQVGEGTADTRRQVTLDELVTQPSERRTVERVVVTLADARLLTTGGPPGDEGIEVSHEALIQGWPRLRGWIDADRGNLLIHRRLTDAAGEWARLDRDAGALYRGAHLSEAAAWMSRGSSEANPLEREFLTASLAAEEASQHRRARRSRTTVIALVIGSVVTAVLGVVATAQSYRLAEEVRVATARQLAAAAVTNLESHPERSILLAVEAVEATHEEDGTVVREAEEALRVALRRWRLVTSVPQGGYGLDVSADGARYATTGTGTDDRVTVRDLATGAALLTLRGPVPGRTTVAFGSGEQLATGHNDGTILLWDEASGEVARILRGHRGTVGTPAFDGDGGRLVTGGVDHTVRVWDTGVGTEVLRIAGLRGLPQPVFSPDGRRIAINTARRATIHDAATGALLTTLRGHEGEVRDVAFHPDGSQLATGGGDGTVRTWDVATGEQLAILVAPAPVEAISYSRDGTRLVGGTTDGSATVWDTETRRELVAVRHDEDVVAVSFTDDGVGVVTSSLDATTRRWDVGPTGERDWLTLPGTSASSGVAFSPDGTLLATRTGPSRISIRDVRDGSEVAGFDSEAVSSFAFGRDGRTLTGASSATLAPPIWDARTGERLLTLTGHDGPVPVAVFDPTGDLVLTGGDDGTVRLWDPRTGREEARSDPVGPVTAASFGSDGRWVAVGNRVGEVVLLDGTTLAPVGRLRGPPRAVTAVASGQDVVVTVGEGATAAVWDPAAGTRRVTLRGHDEDILAVAVSPAGTRVATGSADGTTRLWDRETGRELLTLSGHRGPVSGVAFDPEGRLLATTSADGTVALHVLPVDDLIELARDRVTRSLSDDECRQYLQVPACPGAPP